MQVGKYDSVPWIVWVLVVCEETSLSFPEAAGRDLPRGKNTVFFFPHRRQVQPHTGEKEIARTMESRHLDGFF